MDVDPLTNEVLVMRQVQLQNLAIHGVVSILNHHQS